MDSIIHVKATYEDEARRFQCRPTFQILESSLRSLYSIAPTEQIVITYLDDENEYCRISCQIELDYAVTLPSPLRLMVKLASSKPEQKACLASQEAIKARLDMVNSALQNPNLPPFKAEMLKRKQERLLAHMSGKPSPYHWKHGANETRNWHRGPHHEAPRPCQERQQARLDWINAKLAEPQLSPERFEKLTEKKSFLEAKLSGAPSTHDRSKFWQKKLDFVTAALESPDLPDSRRERLTQKKERLTEKLANPDQHSPRCHRDRGDKTQFRQKRLQTINDALARSDLPDEKRERLTEKKKRLEAKLADPSFPSWNRFEGDKTKFWQMRLQLINDALARPDLPDHKRERLTHKKAFFEAKLENPTTDQQQPVWSGYHGPHRWGGRDHGPHHWGERHHGPHYWGGPHHGPHQWGEPHHGPNRWGEPHHGPHHWGRPHHGPHQWAEPHHGPHQWGEFHHWGGPHHERHYGSRHFGAASDCQQGFRGKRFEEKLKWINQTLEDPNSSPALIAHLTQKKAKIEARMAAHTDEKCPKRAELSALRSAVGTAKVNLFNARQNGLKDAELTPFIDAVSAAKAALCQRRMELKSAAH